MDLMIGLNFDMIVLNAIGLAFGMVGTGLLVWSSIQYPFINKLVCYKSVQGYTRINNNTLILVKHKFNFYTIK
jgi:hypothetical protein